MYTNLPAVNYFNLPDIILKIPIWVQGLQYWYKWQIKSIYYCTINVPSLYDSLYTSLYTMWECKKWKYNRRKVGLLFLWIYKSIVISSRNMRETWQCVRSTCEDIFYNFCNHNHKAWFSLGQKHLICHVVRVSISTRN